ncbi:MAG: hypothetical protein H0V09_03180, partial [Gemmatimonadetes bacterium]|nr:hypothetical protein [Gemmatimonadota bacterium]
MPALERSGDPVEPRSRGARRRSLFRRFYLAFLLASVVALVPLGVYLTSR